MIAASSVVLAAALTAAGSVEILDFSVPGCAPCRQLAPTIKQLQQAGVPVREIDASQYPQYASHYGVDRYPTLILVRDGNELDRIVGGGSYESLLQWYRRAATPEVVRGQNGGVLPRGTDHLGMTEVQPQTPVQPATRQQPETPLPASPPLQTPREAVALRDIPPQRLPNEVTATSGQAATAPLDEAAVQRGLAATVRLKIVDQEGHSYGTGTIIDVHDDEALVLTCGHIFRSSAGKGQIFCDLFVPGAQQGIAGRLISYDLRRDVGLVVLKPGIHVTPVPVAGSGHVARQGASVFAVGCNQGANPTVIRNRILDVNRYHGPPNLVVGGRPIDGRSGGGLFAADGTLIGVCNAADPEYDEGLYAALGNIHAELDAAGLEFVYRPRGDKLAPGSSPGQFTLQGNPAPVPVGQPDRLAANPNTPAAEPATQEHAAPQSQAGEAEKDLVYIRWAQGGTDHVYLLEHPSQEFLQSLSREIHRRGPHMPTQMHVPATDPSLRR